MSSIFRSLKSDPKARWLQVTREQPDEVVDRPRVPVEILESPLLTLFVVLERPESEAHALFSTVEKTEMAPLGECSTVEMSTQ